MSITAEKIVALKTAAAATPEYAEIAQLFTGLYEHLAGRETATGIQIDLASVNPSDRISNGFPLVAPADLRVDRDQAVTFLAGIIGVLARGGREGHEELGRVETALASGQLDPAPLYAAILERRRAPLDEAAQAAGVPAALLEYLCEIPLRTALEQAAAMVPDTVFAGWEEGACPFCGSRAGMAELVGEEGRRYLSCSTCNTRWPYKRLKCAYCGSEEAEKLSYFTVNEGTCRVDVCGACSRYIKTRDGRQLATEAIPLEIMDILTIHLDLLATKEGYERGK